MLKVNAMAFSDMMRLLHTGAYTALELAQQSGLHYVTVCRHLRALRSRRVVIVAGWIGEGRAMRAAYSLATNAQRRGIPRPPPMTAAERRALFRERQQARRRAAA